MELNKCPKCSYTGWGIYCGKCGEKMSEVPKCECGEITWDKIQNYCEKCGKAYPTTKAQP
jgi:hypothetical protein